MEKWAFKAQRKAASFCLLNLKDANLYLDLLPQPSNCMITTGMCLFALCMFAYAVYECTKVNTRLIVAIDLKEGTKALSH